MAQEEVMSVRQPRTKGLVTIDLYEFVSKKLPVRERILGEWLISQSINMIYAKRGVGKTHFSLGVAYAIASGGSFLGWQADRARKVLYIDGEMPGYSLQQRLLAIRNSNPNTPAIKDHLKLITPDLQPDYIMPDLSTFEGQQMVEKVMGDAEVIILDNLSCLQRTGKENEAESWVPVQEWVLKMRRQGRSVIVIHHAGKRGEQRGTSKREDIMDVVIKLERPGNYRPSQGAAFEIHFEKARHLVGDDLRPIYACLSSKDHDVQQWSHEVLDSSPYCQVIELAKEGKTQKEIAEQLGKDKSTISRHMKKAREEGLLSENEN